MSGSIIEGKDIPAAINNAAGCSTDLPRMGKKHGMLKGRW